MPSVSQTREKACFCQKGAQRKTAALFIFLSHPLMARCLFRIFCRQSLFQIFFCQFFKDRQSFSYTFRRHAVGDPEMSRTAEDVARHKHQILFSCFFAESVGIRFQRTREHVKGSARLHAGIPVGDQSVIKNLFVFLIDREVGGVAAYVNDRSLQDRSGRWFLKSADRWQ